jgi:hypothetical protein
LKRASLLPNPSCRLAFQTCYALRWNSHLRTLSIPVWATTQSIVASWGVQHLVDLSKIWNSHLRTLSIPVWATTQSIVASWGVQHLVDLSKI